MARTVALLLAKPRSLQELARLTDLHYRNIRIHVRALELEELVETSYPRQPGQMGRPHMMITWKGN
jgi:predicted ArsR family transcriptional regulator